ncbi:hypothetical protein PUNSTDRAFT_129073 [Punctularia strigosozonata HHB-11173 SS5]|uniref:uncharacterized protein n=1 Tax=Punctularia strigosozonata (strain HHB-11173) TaxID=741275 RepID=UPI000441858D|nr:uncharacterized protein PUNSTDRAFT_129073 [Punctularia strigosozonata HHB-11173 SS5]EIN13385.1 hypothetical protein PUNSTDRAFT_129073 [Punctularia strigosozonata HHB-11173 SS5]
MISQDIRNLLAPPDTQTAEEQCLQELNARFVSWDALQEGDALSSLLADSQHRRDDLHDRLNASQSALDALLTSTAEAASEQLHTAQELSLLRHSLADELNDLSEELVSSQVDEQREPTLLEDVETLHRNLKELQSVKTYVQVVEHGLKLSESVVSNFRERAGAPISLSSLSEYRTLQSFVTSVSEKCEEVLDSTGVQSLHLTKFLEHLRRRTWSEIKDVLAAPLLEAAEKLGWPMKVDYIAAKPQDRKAFEDAFMSMLKFQELGQSIHPTPPEGEQSEKDGVYPLQALVQPVSLRFKYHFEGTRQTNKLDKPEWYFTHILNVAHDQRPFLEAVIQPLLSSISSFKHIVAWREFTYLLLPLPSRKLRRTMPLLLGHPPLLAHTIYQALAFDGALREEGFGLAGTSRATTSKVDEAKEKEWEGVSEVILGRKEWFDVWLEGERKFAEDQYIEIISAPDAWTIAHDESDDGVPSELRPTNSARRVKALVEQVTDRYSPLPQFTHRTRFLISVQLPILEQYHSRISASLDAFETLSSSLVRAVPGALGVGASGVGSGSEQGVRWGGDTRRLTGGVEGDQRLCKALVSARYIANAMETWGEDLFFLELWSEINRRASLRARAGENPLLPDPENDDKTVPDSTIFEELIAQYNKVASRAEEMIVHHVLGEIEGALRAHFAAAISSSPQMQQTEDDVGVSPTLIGSIALLSSHLTFLKSTLPHTTVLALYRSIASRLSLHILQRQVQYRGRGRILPAEGASIHSECELWLETSRSALAGTPGVTAARTEGPWRRLLEAGRLFGLVGDDWRKVMLMTFGAHEDEKWEELVAGVVGFSELSREEVGQILRTRSDCEL